MKTNDDIINLIRSDTWRMDVLRCVRSLGLHDWAIGAGFIRAAVWDVVSHKRTPTLVPDIDVLYFSSSSLAKQNEKEIEDLLQKIMPGIPWSAKNQARMHIRNGDQPYYGTADALKFWLETPTAIAVRLEADDNLTLIAPYGIDDLLNMKVRPTPRGLQKIDQFLERIKTKGWSNQWPELTVEY